MEIKLKSIGIIHSPFKEPKGVPIQPLAAEGIKGTVEVFKGFKEGLTDLEDFSHIILIYYFHMVKNAVSEEKGADRKGAEEKGAEEKGAGLLVKPYMDTRLHGVFATRAPGRPNPIGISVVRLYSIKDNLLTVLDLDVVDGTPLLDIKPYVPDFDIRNVKRIGWLTKNVRKLKTSRDDGRFL